MVKCGIHPYEHKWTKKRGIEPMSNEEAKPCRFRREGLCTVNPDELEFQFNWSGVFWCETRSKTIIEEITNERPLKPSDLNLL